VPVDCLVVDNRQLQACA